MKKVALFAALLCGTSFSALASEIPHSQATKVAEQGVTLEDQTYVEYRLEYVEYHYEMCGHSGIATGNSVDEVVELLNMLEDMYCG